MKTTVKRCIAVVAFLAIAGYLFVHISYMLKDPLAHTRNNLGGYYELDKDSLDVVFVGTSGSFSAFSPMTAWEKYGFASYNFCTNVMGTNCMANAVHEAMKTQSPELLVIDVSPFAVFHRTNLMPEHEIRYNTDGYRYSWDRVKLILDAVPDTQDKIPYIFDLVKYHTYTLNWQNYFGTYHFVAKGYNALTWITADPPTQTEKREELAPEFEEDMDKLLAECNRQSVPNVLFICYPYGDYADLAIINYIQDRVEAAGYPFLNCERIWDEFGLDCQRDYCGAMHFNIYGAEKITSVLGEYLKTTYDLPDRRDDPAYKSWSEDLDIYRRDVKTQKAAVDAAIAQANGT